MLKIPCTLMRSGTSKAAFLLKKDLPIDKVERDSVLLRLMGSPDMRQVDGIGGGDPLSSKIAIVDKYEGEDADISFLFAQVLLDRPEVNTQANCGNILSGVGPFAIENGLIDHVNDPETVIRVYNENTQSIVTTRVKTPDGQITYEGETEIDGVPGKSAPIHLNFGNMIGTSTGKLFPTGSKVDLIDGIEVSCLDVSIPVIFIEAASLNKSGNETKEELDNDVQLIDCIENIRVKILKKMQMPYSPLIPKVSMVSKPRHGGNITSRYFTPLNCHAAHAVTGALCLSTASLVKGTVAEKVANFNNGRSDCFIVEHPSGNIPVITKLRQCSNDEYYLEKSEFVRTARPLFEGNVLVREISFDHKQ